MILDHQTLCRHYPCRLRPEAVIGMCDSASSWAHNFEISIASAFFLIPNNLTPEAT